MSVDFHFCELFEVPPLYGKNHLNEECVKKVINAFPADKSTLIKNQDILFFFNDRIRFRYPDELGSMILKDSLDYGYFKDNFSYELNKISNFSDYVYIIYIAKKTAENDCEIFKSLTIAHELQHILQAYYIDCIVHRDILLKKYFKLKEICSAEKYRRFPTEIDAFILAKRITSRIYDEKNVNAFLKEKITKIDSRIAYTRDLKSRNKYEGDKLYWECIKLIEIASFYDLESEFQTLWNRYKTEMEKEFFALKKKQKHKEKEDEFFQAYKIYSEKC